MSHEGPVKKVRTKNKCAVNAEQKSRFGWLVVGLSLIVTRGPVKKVRTKNKCAGNAEQKSRFGWLVVGLNLIVTRGTCQKSTDQE